MRGFVQRKRKLSLFLLCFWFCFCFFLCSHWSIHSAVKQNGKHFFCYRMVTDCITTRRQDSSSFIIYESTHCEVWISRSYIFFSLNDSREIQKINLFDANVSTRYLMFLRQDTFAINLFFCITNVALQRKKYILPRGEWKEHG